LTIPPIQPTPEQKKRALVMIVIFTFMAAIGQTFMKSGSARLAHEVNLQILLADTPLWIGLIVYCCGAALVVLALRHGELNVLYPIISLSNVWVAIFAVTMFHESMTVVRALGILTIVAGVAILGRGASR